MSQGIGGVSGLTIMCAVNSRTKANHKSKGKSVKLVQTKEEGKHKNVGFGEKKEPLWQCVQQCGACCKLAKGPSFATPEEIFDNPHDIQLYKSLVGADGWCIHYDKSNRKCSIYDERPYFCRVEQDVFRNLYGISKKKFNKEACRSYFWEFDISLLAIESVSNDFSVHATTTEQSYRTRASILDCNAFVRLTLNLPVVFRPIRAISQKGIRHNSYMNA